MSCPLKPFKSSSTVILQIKGVYIMKKWHGRLQINLMCSLFPKNFYAYPFYMFRNGWSLNDVSFRPFWEITPNMIPIKRDIILSFISSKSSSSVPELVSLIDQLKDKEKYYIEQGGFPIANSPSNEKQAVFWLYILRQILNSLLRFIPDDYGGYKSLYPPECCSAWFYVWMFNYYNVARFVRNS